MRSLLTQLGFISRLKTPSSTMKAHWFLGYGSSFNHGHLVFQTKVQSVRPFKRNIANEMVDQGTTPQGYQIEVIMTDNRRRTVTSYTGDDTTQLLLQKLVPKKEKEYVVESLRKGVLAQ